MKRPIVVVVGTRPDALKLIPIYIALRKLGRAVFLCATNQHRELLDQVFGLFDVAPDVELQIMKASQDLDYITASVLEKTTALFKSLMPCMVIVQGDTTSSFAAALAAYYLSVPVAHVEAGLRTGNIYSPFPEEINRSFIAKISALHFAPTPLNLSNL